MNTVCTEASADQRPATNNQKPSPRIERALLDLPIVKADGSVVFPMVEIYLHDDGTMKAGRVSIYEAPASSACADDLEATLRRNALHELRIGRYDDAAVHLQDLLALRLSRLGGGA